MGFSASLLSFFPGQENCRSDEKRGLFALSFMSLAVGSSEGECQDPQVNLPQFLGRVIVCPSFLGAAIIPRSETHHPFANEAF